jgi:hypothetical protein
MTQIGYDQIRFLYTSAYNFLSLKIIKLAEEKFVINKLAIS